MESNTCIRFVPKQDSDLDWLEIYSTGASGCFANSRSISTLYVQPLGEVNLESMRTVKTNRGINVFVILHFTSEISQYGF